ncbi:MAG: NAD(P)/FAD-dependent oxidoreductase [Candidatus Omnitrophica bacterium]|nr:NAD(P)/FAD-dependent oxidoreductase [Candidatus Omnitrophota bacterium]
MKSKYDVIIIGAGIGGLVCGCYLEKQGISSIILERLNKPGGYCSSFKVNHHSFDVGPHSFGSCRKEGQIGKLIRELELESKLIFKQKSLSNIIKTPEYTVNFGNNVSKTISSLQEIFPEERKNIDGLFTLITEKNFMYLYSQLKGKTFQQILDKFLKNHKLKTILGVLVGNLGLSPVSTAALTAVILYREHIFDGGYYPSEGTQKFSDVLADKYQDLGGEIVFQSEVKKILIKNNKAKGVITRNEKFINGNCIVSNCDAVHTYTKLIGEENLDESFLETIHSLVPSPSFFVVHLGLTKPIKNSIIKCSTFWFLDSYDIETIYKDVRKSDVFTKRKYIVMGFPYLEKNEDETDVISLLVLASYKDGTEWEKDKNKLAESLIKQAKQILPEISDNISSIWINTPDFFNKYTFNSGGSISGWASTPEQVESNSIGLVGNVANLYHCGHWVTSPGGQGGIPMVIYSGKATAKKLML